MDLGLDVPFLLAETFFSNTTVFLVSIITCDTMSTIIVEKLSSYNFGMNLFTETYKSSA